MSTGRSSPYGPGDPTKAVTPGTRTPVPDDRQSRPARDAEDPEPTGRPVLSLKGLAVASLLFICTTASVLAIYAVSLAVFQNGLPEFYAKLPAKLVAPLLPIVVMSAVVVSHILTLCVARRTTIGWAAPLVAIAILIVEVLAAAFVIGFERVDPAGMVPADAWIDADRASNLALFGGLALVCACTLVVVAAARSKRRPASIAWRLCHGILLTLAWLYGAAPAALAVWV